MYRNKNFLLLWVSQSISGAAGWLGELIGIRQTFVFGGAMLVLGGVAMGWMFKGINLEKDESQALAAEGLV